MPLQLTNGHSMHRRYEYLHPCSQVEKVQYDFIEVDRVNRQVDNVTSWFGISLFFPVLLCVRTWKKLRRPATGPIQSGAHTSINTHTSRHLGPQIISLGFYPPLEYAFIELLDLDWFKAIIWPKMTPNSTR